MTRGFATKAWLCLWAIWLGLSCHRGTSSEPSGQRSASGFDLSTSVVAPDSAAAAAPDVLYTGGGSASDSPPPLGSAPLGSAPLGSAPLGSALLSPELNSQHQGEAERRPLRVAVVGDSLTDYASHGGKYIRYLEQRCPKSRFDNFGKGADMVNQMRRRYQSQVGASADPYTHVVVFGGVNDLYSDLTASRTNDKIEADLAKMYEWARESGAKVVALTVAPWGGFKRYFNERRSQSTELLNDWIRAQLGVRVDFVVDAYRLLSCGQPTELCPELAAPFKDGIHFGPRGHEVLGRALFEDVFGDCL